MKPSNEAREKVTPEEAFFMQDLGSAMSRFITVVKSGKNWRIKTIKNQA